ncbi:stage VI sporulation protein D [Bacillus marinisedimentorum]|uniref:stage VI sporulation protein D n=1 Tax=Bacillus marinisedimentorum TaxID=1821260 RepID=UPI000871D3BB|nr:stage VI sporulation protein D [Bacillus marinisedimentorum]
MSEDYNQSLRFSVEETVWFERGQEVSEMVSMSLEPDIVIQEHNQHVSIKGALLLSGEYRAEDSDGDESADEARRGMRLIDRVQLNEDGTSVLEHRFPIDITVPKTRVEDLNDVYVTIETFDYELPRKGCLQLSADLSISGISTSRPKAAAEPEPVRQETTAVEPEQKHGTQSEAEGNADQADQVADTSKPVEKSAYETEASFPESGSEVPDQRPHEPAMAEEPAKDIEKQENAGKTDFQEEPTVLAREDLTIEGNGEAEIYDETAGFAPLSNEAEVPGYDDKVISFSAESRKKADIASEEEQAEEPKELQIGMKGRQEEKEHYFMARGEYEEPVEEPEAEEAAAPKSAHSKKRDENAIYLTKFLSSEQDDFSRLKMYIVQDGDSLDAVAERYELQTGALIRVNRLEQDDVYAGQILYIPVAESKV